jgi:hypothetical protein
MGRILPSEARDARRLFKETIDLLRRRIPDKVHYSPTDFTSVKLFWLDEWISELLSSNACSNFDGCNRYA